MSFKLMQACVDMQAPELTVSDFSVLIVLCRFADDDGRNCYPSLPVISEKAHVNIKTARKSVRALDACGLISVRREKNSRIVYTINVQKIYDSNVIKNDEEKVIVEATKSGTLGKPIGTTKNGTGGLPKMAGERLPKVEPNNVIEKNKKNECIPSTTSDDFRATKSGIPAETIEQALSNQSKCYEIAQKISRNRNWLMQVDPQWIERGRLKVDSFATYLYIDKPTVERHKALISKVLSGGRQ